MADEPAEKSQDDKSKNSKKKLIIIVALVVLVIGTAVATWLLSGDEQPSTEITSDQPNQSSEQGQASYYPIKPPFVVNFVARGKQRLVQISIVLMARSDLAIEGVQAHQALIRNTIVLKIGAANFDSLQTHEGKELLRQELRADVNKLLTDEGLSLIDDLYFTNFVMQ